MRKWLVRLLVVVLVGAGIYALRVTYFAPVPIEVTVVRPEKGRVESTITNSKAGTVKARRRADLSPEMGGRVIELDVAAGESVVARQVLLRLDASSQRAQLEKARRDVITAEARREEACLAAEQAQREYVRHQALADRLIVSQSLLEQLESQSRTAAVGCSASAAAIESARATEAILDNEIAKTVLRAPFDGVIAELSVELGEYVTPSPPGLPIPPVMEIIDTSSIFISAPMDEVDSARVKPGQPVRVTIDPFPDQEFPGRVDRVAPYVLDLEAQNRTVEIEVRLADAEFASTLLPGTSTDVEVILETREDVLRIPTSTLLEGNAVLLLEADVIVRREVQIGLRNWDFVEIRGGLSADDRVVTSLDRLEVQPGAEARIAGESPG